MLLAAATKLAARIIAGLQPLCARIEVAGSIRRGRPDVNDIDLVLIPVAPASLPAIQARCRQNADAVKEGLQNSIYRLKGGFQLDLYFAHAGVKDLLFEAPSNWGSLLLCRTGCKEHNVWLASRAKVRGLHWDPYEGLKRKSTIIAAASELAIYTALDLPLIEPARREIQYLNFP